MINYLIKLFLDPIVLVFAFVVLAWLFSLTPFRKLTRRLIFLSAMVLGLIYIGPLPALLSQPLASRFPPADLDILPEPELIVVLGGMTSPKPLQEPGGRQPSFTHRSERFLAGLQLAKKFPTARLVFTGWSGEAAGVEGAEATRLAALAVSLGIPLNQILIDPLSQTTADHPVQLELKSEIGRDPDIPTYIVTSAVHMPRAMGVFRASGWTNVHAVPADYPFPPETSWFSRRQPAGKKATITRDALVEWVGLMNYRWKGLTTQVLPSP